MSTLHEAITPKIADFIRSQSVFFVATAPLATHGHLNISPKGIPGTACVVDDRQFAYLDITGSGAETIAHLRENGRIVVMFCAFEGPPNIVRLHGKGRVIDTTHAQWTHWAARFADVAGARAVILVDVERVSDSCGYGVPNMTLVGDRDLLPPFMARKGASGQVQYRQAKNRMSIDGLPVFESDGLSTQGGPHAGRAT